MEELLEGKLKAVQGDITKLSVDAVVNAANSSLLGGGGVDGAIHRAGGPEILDACKAIRKTQYPDGLPAGQAVITGGGRLPSSYVIHTVGPVWHGGNSGEDALLAGAYRNALRIAAEKQLRRIAFPAISTGVYGFPKKRAAEIAYSTIKEFIAQHPFPAEVLLVFFSQSDLELFIATAGPLDS